MLTEVAAFRYTKYLIMKCDTPYYVSYDGGEVPAPCGRCPNCKTRRVNEWVFRLMEEDKVSSSSYFITLTYDTRFVPISPNGFMTLDKKEFPKFMKRLRKLCPGSTLKYYACGEYGSKNNRPHYHAIVFNVPDSTLFAKAWTIDGNQLGTVHVGQVSSDSVAYTMKYIDKSRFTPMHDRDDRVPEFPLMSKGLGKSYLTDQVKAYHRADLSRLYLTKAGGYKISMPRYYRKQIYSDDEIRKQTKLIGTIVGNEEKALFDQFQRSQSNVHSEYRLDFLKWKETVKRERYNAFYRKQKSRNL